MIKRRLCFLLALLSGTVAFSQLQPDTAFVATAKANALAEYSKALRTQARLYNGSRYLPPEHDLEEHPYFVSPDWINGSVYYDGEYFSDVPLMYDLYNQTLVAEHASSGHPIRLVEEKLQYFTLEGHYFERIINDSVQNSLPATGIYEVLYRGPTKVVARRQQQLREQIVSTVIERSYDEKNRYFILRDSAFFPVKGKASVLKLLSARKNDIKRFLRQKDLSFSTNRELALKSIAEYYDQSR